MATRFFAGLKTFVRKYLAHSPSKMLFSENWEDIEEYVPDL